MASAFDVYQGMFAAKVAMIEASRRACKNPGMTFEVELFIGSEMAPGQTTGGTVRLMYNGAGMPQTEGSLPPLEKTSARHHKMEVLFALNIYLPRIGEENESYLVGLHETSALFALCLPSYRYLKPFVYHDLSLHT